MNTFKDSRLQTGYAVVVLSFNHPELTQKCVKSVIKLGIESVFLVHNGSEVKNFNYLTRQFPQVRHIPLIKNQGFSGGANHGLHEAFKHFKQVLFLTNDTELVSLGLPPKQKGLFSIKLLKRKSDEKIDSVLGVIDTKNGSLKHLKSDKEVSALLNKTDNLTKLPYVPGTAFWIDKDTFYQAQGFDESYHTYWEDVDLSFRLHNQNPDNIGYWPTTVARHKIGKTCHKNDFYTFFLFQKNRKKFMQKHHLAHFNFWFRFYKDVLVKSKGRWNYVWRIINE